MILDSVPLMTAIDLLIIAVTVYGIWRCRLIGRGQRFGRPRTEAGTQEGIGHFSSIVVLKDSSTRSDFKD
jgi:hypothetical protein